MKINYSDLSNIFFTVSNLFPVCQKGKGKTEFVMEKPRHTDAFLLFTGCTSICYQKDEAPIFIPQGSLVYMPRYSKYMWENTPANADGTTETLLFEFTLSYADTVRSLNDKHDFNINSLSGERIYFSDKVEIVSVSHKELYRKLFTNLISAFNKENASTLEVYISAYEIFKTVADDKSHTARKNDYGIISSAVEYIENSRNPEKNISELAGMCNISTGYFERLFKEYSGMRPVEYISARKLFYIKELLHDKSLSLEEIAEKAGFCDSGYLCRIFKKKTGMTPGEYRKMSFIGKL